MRKIIVVEFITLDGVMQAPGGSKEDTAEGFKYGGWMGPYFDDFSGRIMAKQMKTPFSLLLGRKTFQIWENYWPQNEDKWKGVNDATKYVVSKTLKKSNWVNSVFINKNVVSELKKLKKGKGPDLKVWGSSNLAQTLFKNDLVDELWLKIFPLTIGSGKKLFEDGTVPRAFKLMESNISPTGVIFANYKRAGKVKTRSVE